MVKLNDYNADKVEPTGAFDPLPAGEYVVWIEHGTDMKDNKQGTGQYLKLVYSVVEGPYQGRKIFENLNLHFDDVEENEKHAMAVKIANDKLRQICFAVGNHTPRDTEELCEIAFVARVGIKKGNDEFPDPQNKVTKCRALSEGPAKGPMTKPAPAGAPAPGSVAPAEGQVQVGGQGAPWRNRNP